MIDSQVIIIPDKEVNHITNPYKQLSNWSKYLKHEGVYFPVWFLSF